MENGKYDVVTDDGVTQIWLVMKYHADYICTCRGEWDGKRIAACLNACVAWSTEAIETRGVTLAGAVPA